jgi:Leucine-rich repeat (LRR) protein
MTPEEEAYEEAVGRIREAEKTGAVELDLSGMKDGKVTELETLTRLPPELERLTSLRSLNLFGCQQLSGDLSPLAGFTSLLSLNLKGCELLSGDLSRLAGLTSLQSLNLARRYTISDLSPLAGLVSLQTLNLAGCELSDLSPLASLTSLESLDLSLCLNIRRFSPIESLLPRLKRLYLYGCNFDDLPFEACGEDHKENVLDKVRSRYRLLSRPRTAVRFGEERRQR